MTQASIGHHCPECLAQNNQQVYTARTLPGRRPVLITALIAVNVLAFVLQQGSGDQLTVDGLLFGPAVADGEVWRIVTSAFLHGSLIHIGFNMYALWILGNPLEEGLGWPRFSLLYLAGLFGGAMAVLAFDYDAPTLGASGAVLGLGGALAAVLWSRGVKLTQTSLGFVLGLNLVLPLIASRISFWGHFGGIVAGFVAGALIGWLPRLGRSDSLAVAATAAWCAVLAVGSVLVARAGGLL